MACLLYAAYFRNKLHIKHHNTYLKSVAILLLLLLFISFPVFVNIDFCYQFIPALYVMRTTVFRINTDTFSVCIDEVNDCIITLLHYY